jgi:hypothetical protein
MNLREATVSDLLKLVKAVSKPFDNRDTIYDNRRKIRFRKMDAELRSLPLSNRAGTNQALLVFQTEEVNQEVHRRVKRLIANKPRIEVIVYDADEESKRRAQDIEDGLKALWKWMNRGKVPAEQLATEFQQGDGLGWFKLDFIPSYADDVLAPFNLDYLLISDEEFEPLIQEFPEDERDRYVSARMEFISVRNRLSEQFPDEIDIDARAYKEVTDKYLRRTDPPFRLSAPDPRTIYYRWDGDALDIVIEKGKRQINALLEAFGDHGLKFINNRFVMLSTESDAVSSPTISEQKVFSGEYSDLCDYIEIRTRKEIVILIRHPTLMKSRRIRREEKEEDDYVCIKFENPFGPYSTGYIPVPADATGSPDPAEEFQPPVLGTLSVAQHLNILTTIRTSAAVDKALAGKYIKSEDVSPPPALSQQQSEKTPEVKDGTPVPVIPGEVRREETVNIDLDKAELFLNQMMASYRFNEVLAGDAQSSDSGHKLAIQVSQADTQLVPYQNARASAIAEVLLSCLYAVKKFGQPVYIKEIPDQHLIMMNKVSKVQPVRALTPDMCDMDFNLVVTIGSETPVTKFAKWAALEQRFKAGTLSFETLMEQSDVENVGDEIARIFEGQTLVAVMQQAIPVIVRMIADRALAKLGALPSPGLTPIPGQGGNESGGGMPGASASTPIASLGRMPGVGMSPAGPTVDTYGPRVHEGSGELETNVEI